MPKTESSPQPTTATTSTSAAPTTASKTAQTTPFKRKSWITCILFALVAVFVALNSFLQNLPDYYTICYQATVGNEPLLGNNTPTTTNTTPQGGTAATTNLTWFTKLGFNTSTPSGGFVHIGKSGGSTISAMLRNGCHSFVRKPCRTIDNETALSLHIQKYYHVPDAGKIQPSTHDFYLISLRNPYDRFVSAFVYEHILNRMARPDEKQYFGPKKLEKYMEVYKCFPTLDSFVEYLQGDFKNFKVPSKIQLREFEFPVTETEQQIVCRNLARAAVAGKVPYFVHMHLNYRMAREGISDTAVILSTRQEFLWEDWIHINKLMGHDKPIQPATESRIRDTSDLVLPVSRTLHASLTEVLCDALQDEFEAYLSLVRDTKNFNSQDVEDAVKGVQARCPNAKVSEGSR